MATIFVSSRFRDCCHFRGNDRRQLISYSLIFLTVVVRDVIGVLSFLLQVISGILLAAVFTL